MRAIAWVGLTTFVAVSVASCGGDDTSSALKTQVNGLRTDVAALRSSTPAPNLDLVVGLADECLYRMEPCYPETSAHKSPRRLTVA